jgi:hypothetical protein
MAKKDPQKNEKLSSTEISSKQGGGGNQRAKDKRGKREKGKLQGKRQNEGVG